MREVYRALDAGGDRPALADAVERFSCCQLLDRARELVSVLREGYGVGPGTPVAVLAWSSPHAFALQLAVHHLGGRLVAVHPGAPASEQAAFLRSCRAELVVLEGPRFGDSGRALEACLPSGSAIGSLSPIEGFSWLGGPSSTHSIPEISDDFSTVLYTGGTTGSPKPVLQGGRFYRMVLQVAAWGAAGTGRCGADFVCTSLTHASGQMSAILSLLGGRALEARQDCTAEELLELIERRCVTGLFLFPSKLGHLLDMVIATRWRRPRNLRYLTYGGGPMSVARIDEAQRLLCPELTQVYGLTEATLVCSLGPDEHRDPMRRHLRSCGRAIPYMECQVRADDGSRLPTGDVGDVCVRGPFATPGYLDEAGTLRPFPGGWCRTGDIGRLDRDGYLYLVDRAKDVIVTGTSTNLYSQLLEDQILQCPSVAQAAVIGVPDRVHCETAHACLVPAAGSVIDVEELNRAIVEAMGEPYRLASVDICDSLPQTSLGKIDKAALRARFWSKPEDRVALRE
ncbi:MAG: class I adenylate-forming enzyme family protein [Acidimicrobiales bacterium]